MQIEVSEIEGNKATISINVEDEPIETFDVGPVVRFKTLDNIDIDEDKLDEIADKVYKKIVKEVNRTMAFGTEQEGLFEPDPDLMD